MPNDDRQITEKGQPYWGEDNDDDRAEKAVVAGERRREKSIARFAEKQRQLRQWIKFSDIADWCAREGGSINPDRRLVESAYQQLGQSLLNGEFESDGRTRVIFLEHHVAWFKMTRVLFDAAPYDSKPGDSKQEYLKYCWIPNSLCRAWFERKRLPTPEWLDASWRAHSEEDIGLSGPYAEQDIRSDSRTSTGPATALRQASSESVSKTISAVYDHAERLGMKPPNVREIGPYVVQLLARDGFCATAAHVQEIAGNTEHQKRRGKSGRRVNASFHPFSLEGWVKAGVES